MYTSVLVCGVFLAHFSGRSIAQDIVFEDTSSTSERNDTTLLTRGTDTTTMRTEAENPPKPAQECGVSKAFTITPLIINGTEARVGTFPWHAGIYYRTKENNKPESWKQLCGGSLINDRFILTAAHCVYLRNKEDLRVALGKYFRSWDHYEYSEQKRNVSKITYPEDYDTNTFYFDFALLLLNEKIKLGAFIMPVCIGLLGDSNHLHNKTLFVVGWGITESGSPSETLLYNGDSMIVSRRTCKKSIPMFYSLIDKICVGINNSDTSAVQLGDSGGGMTVEHDGLHFILGIVSVKFQNTTVITNITEPNNFSWIKREVAKYDSKLISPEAEDAMANSSRGCVLPDATAHYLVNTRRFCLLSAGCEDCDIYTTRCHVPSGSSVGQVKVVCAPGYKTETSDIAVCVGSVWHPPVSKCIKLCHPLVSETLQLKCRYGNDPVPCSDLALPGTTVSFECQSSFSQNPDSKRQGVYRSIITCGQSGEWSANLTSCTAGCGVSREVTKFSATILNGTNANIGFFPWHAGLYYRVDKDGKTFWDQQCGGSLITDRVVLTAAHCLMDVTDVNNLRVALGKYYRSWDTQEPTEEKRNVSDIALPSEFNRNILTFDVALVLLSERIKLGEYIMPVCLDYGERTTHLQNYKLYVVGWGKISSAIQGPSSENLLYNTVTILSENACHRELPFFYSTFEKFCAVKDNSESITQKGDSGGGLTAVYEDGLHYIVGVISAKLNQTSLFTNVKYKTHTEWINFKIRQFAKK